MAPSASSTTRSTPKGQTLKMADAADPESGETSPPAGGAPRGGDYDASSIEVLEGLEAVRKRPGMYIGGTGSGGLTHLLWEIIDNAVDEAAAGHGKLIEVTLHDDGSYEVVDRGRGIPIDIKHDNITAVEVVFTELHAGGKFGNGAYGASGGLHGVGASVVNALCGRMEVDVHRKGATHRLEFKNQKAGHSDSAGRFRESHKLKRVGRVSSSRTGTRVRFWPDTDIFDPAATVDFDEVRERITQVCFLVPKVKISIADRRREPVVVEEIVSSGGLGDYVDKLSGNDEPVTGLIRLTGSESFTERVPVDGKLTDVERQCDVEIALRWTSAYDTRIVGFVNTIPTPEGGTHIAGFERALTTAVNSALAEADPRKLRRLKDDARAQREDAQEGLVAVVRATFAEPQFRGQTKRELGTPQVQRIVSNVVREGLRAWFDGSHPGSRKTHVRALIDRLADAVVNRVESRRALDQRRKAAALGTNGMPDKLADCRLHPEGELLIVEGDSAAGPAKRARDSAWQAVLPLRGKVVNAGKGTLRSVLDNAEATALFTALGAGSGPEFDADSCRYERVVLLADADVDGSHIRCLVLTLMYHYMRPLLEAGRVYAAQPPTHAFTIGADKRFVYSDAERGALVTELDAAGRRYRLTRFKGLGEMDDDELFETTLNPDTRVLRRIGLGEARAEQSRAAEAFKVMMGSEVEPRRKFIVKHSQAYGQALDI
ncbi:MAG: ATP-binding protein [Acidimicrobiaceae bacterium]|nr:ATP-binding protein [Acidimicrobiaceae bacterium]MDE0499331.1 ATP-binding protein [Acidimicrobiaceae bacterium]